jgi:hypothetical protein
MADQVLMENKVPNLYEHWKSPILKETDIRKFHEAGWLPADLLCSPITLDFLMINRTHMVCLESHSICSLGLTPSKFLIVILSFLGCELIHHHLNTIATLSCFCMLCECCLCIPPDTSLFWYFYSRPDMIRSCSLACR